MATSQHAALFLAGGTVTALDAEHFRLCADTHRQWAITSKSALYFSETVSTITFGKNLGAATQSLPECVPCFASERRHDRFIARDKRQVLGLVDVRGPARELHDDNAPPGVDQYLLAVHPDQAGHFLLVSVQPQEVVVCMQRSAREAELATKLQEDGCANYSAMG